MWTTEQVEFETPALNPRFITIALFRRSSCSLSKCLNDHEGQTLKNLCIASSFSFPHKNV